MNRTGEGQARRFQGTFPITVAYQGSLYMEEEAMDGLIYLVGLIVIILAILSFFGLR